MNAVIGLENGVVVARFYNEAGKEYAHIAYGLAGQRTKAEVVAHIEAQGHQVVEPWDIKEVQDDRE